MYRHTISFSLSQGSVRRRGNGIICVALCTESERVTERVRELVVARSSFLVSTVPAGNIKNRKARTAVAIIVVVVLYK